MTPHLTAEEQAWLADAAAPGRAMALRIVARAARMLRADRLIPISSAHVDGCLYHGDGGVDFAERLVASGAGVGVPTTLNVGALDLAEPGRVKGSAHHREMSKRLMDAHLALGCRPSWTCAPYQAGHRPAFGAQVAWGESNAIAFVNSVLGARTERYGDFLDICCAVTGRAPRHGLHMTENRRATLVFDIAGLKPELRASEALYPVLGALIGKEAGGAVPAIVGAPADIGEDSLKALGAGAAATGRVGLFHVAGRTPEAPTLDAALQGRAPARTVRVTPEMVRAWRDRLGTAAGGQLDCVALGSPHFSAEQCRRLIDLAGGRRFRIPVYVCTGRHVTDADPGLVEGLRALGATVVRDTCVVVTPILKDIDGVMMTDSAKFAHYARPNTGYRAVFGALADCVESAVAGTVRRDETIWR